jgi:pimeloyl-ACP methyl ester carboxylesterase
MEQHHPGPGEEHRRVRRHGADVAYGVRRTAQAVRGIVLLHGLASNMTRWSEFVEHSGLARDSGSADALLRIDLRGHGASTTAGPINLDLWCDDLAAVLAQERLSRAVLVGHSLGAQVALQFAARRPALVDALVLIDPVFREALSGRWRLLALASPLLGGAAALLRAANALGIRRRLLPPYDLRELDRQARIALQSPDAEADFVRHYSSATADLQRIRTAHYLQDLVALFHPLPPLARLAVPTLVLLSTGATFAALDATRRIAARLPQGRIATIDCHHWPLTERPDEVRALIEDFVRTLPGATLAARPDHEDAQTST